MKKLFSLPFFLIVFLAAGAQTNEDPVKGDPFDYMLDQLGISESDLGYSPKGYWTRYPDPQDIPFKFLAFDDLMAEPHRMYDFVRNMALSVEDYLHPEYLEKNNDGLLKIAYYCGISMSTSQFRQYSASLWAKTDSTAPLLGAIKDIYVKSGRVYKFNAMGQASDFPLIEDEINEAIKDIHPAIRAVVAENIINLTEAYKWCKLAMRNVDYKDAAACWRIRRLGETQFDGLEYYPELEDCANDIDMNSIYYAGYKLLQSSETLADTLAKLRKSNMDIDWSKQNMEYNTPIGRIVLSGTGNDIHDYDDALLVVDFGGDDTYHGSAGATASLDLPLSLLVDLEGNDLYVNNSEYKPAQGAAIFGAAMLLDLKGNDEYISKRLSQGAAMLGIGILADMDGDDKYDMWTSGQGGAYFGVGLAIDNKGDDEYRIWGDGQGYGGVGGGIGTLVNRSGNDLYWAEFDASKVHRPDYHSKDGEHNYTYCQGSGVGRRGDVTDGHSWAGGMGTIIDIEGDDEYISGNWSQACGYWYGAGFLYDGSGNDKYKSTTWSMTCGAHFCLAAFIDEGGDDEHIMWEKQSVGMGFGHDYTVGLFLNKGGNDYYRLRENGFGYAINMSQVFFIDTEGDDSYIRDKKGNNFGWNNFDKHNPPNVESLYHLYSNQVCLFGDFNGTDTYLIRDFESGEETADSLMQDGGKLFQPADKSELAGKQYYGLGIDLNNTDSTEVDYFRFKMKKRFKDK